MGILGSVRGTQQASGTSLSILRERTSGLGNSRFNTALSSIAEGISNIVMKSFSRLQVYQFLIHRAQRWAIMEYP